MSNRRKPAASVPIRQALLHALDVEYARAAKVKNLARMEEIAEIVRQLQGIWQDIPTQDWQAVTDPTPPPEPPAPAEQPDEPPPLELPSEHLSRDEFDLSDLMAAVDAQEQPPEPMPEPEPEPVISEAEPEQATVPLPVLPSGDGERRRHAHALVRKAVADVNRINADEQFRYELALLVRNENVEAMSDMQAAAAVAGLPVKEYAARTIAVHNARRRRAAQVYAIEARALKGLEAASGDDIDAIAAQAVQEIRGDEE